MTLCKRAIFTLVVLWLYNFHSAMATEGGTVTNLTLEETFIRIQGADIRGSASWLEVIDDPESGSTLFFLENNQPAKLQMEITPDDIIDIKHSSQLVKRIRGSEILNKEPLKITIRNPEQAGDDARDDDSVTLLTFLKIGEPESAAGGEDQESTDSYNYSPSGEDGDGFSKGLPKPTSSAPIPLFNIMDILDASRELLIHDLFVVAGLVKADSAEKSSQLDDGTPVFYKELFNPVFSSAVIEDNLPRTIEVHVVHDTETGGLLLDISDLEWLKDKMKGVRARWHTIAIILGVKANWPHDVDKCFDIMMTTWLQETRPLSVLVDAVRIYNPQLAIKIKLKAYEKAGIPFPEKRSALLSPGY